MINTKTATLANFNCTFRNNEGVFPLLEYMDTLIIPAISNKAAYRTDDSKKNKYFISDIKLVKLENGEYALTGKHIKRTLLSINQDYDVEKGFIHKGEVHWSAPFSTFILLLKNHRLIYFHDQDGSPNIKSFSATIRSIVSNYIKGQRYNYINLLKNNNFKLNNIKYTNIKDYKDKYLDIYLPLPELNIVPIESEALVKNKFKQIDKIVKIKFKVYKPNSEEFAYGSMFDDFIDIIDKTEANYIDQVIHHPRNIAEVENLILSSKGKSSYTLDAKDSDNNKISLTPENVSETKTITYDDTADIDINVNTIYNELQGEVSITECNDENYKIYLQNIDKIKKILEII